MSVTDEDEDDMIERKPKTALQAVNFFLIGLVD